MIPKCPDHPNGKVVKARKSATTEGVYLCLVCGKKLGDAGHVPVGTWEPFNVRATNVKEKKP